MREKLRQWLREWLGVDDEAERLWRVIRQQGDQLERLSGSVGELGGVVAKKAFRSEI
jgi:hypothetical protein